MVSVFYIHELIIKISGKINDKCNKQQSKNNIMKTEILRHQDKDLVYYEHKPTGLLAFTIATLVNDLYNLYSIDYRAFIFKPEQIN